MAIRFLDTAALIKLYFVEDGTDMMLQLVRSEARHTLVVLATAPVELLAQLRQRVASGDLSRADGERVRDQLCQHMRTRFVSQPITGRVIKRATALLERHALGPQQALQLAACTVLVESDDDAEAAAIVSSDSAILAAAAGEGLAGIDPTVMPLTH